ncbi:Ig-like domain-containing protein [Microbispora sp. CA-102843]|uniref:Ig-like domain-containing protein n=1 Tax=Microbispora sp. CA-102843 TaxID=3239952 RepID=UPI003D8A46BE
MDGPAISRRAAITGLVGTAAVPLLVTGSPALASADASPIAFASPADGSTGVPRDRVLTAYLTAPATSGPPPARLDGPDGMVETDVAYQVGERAVSVIPRGRLKPGRRYTLSVEGTPATTFTTAANPHEPEVLARTGDATLSGHWLDEALLVRIDATADGPVTLSVRTAAGRTAALALPARVARAVPLAEVDGELVGAVVTEISLSGPSLRVTALSLESGLDAYAALPDDTPRTGRSLPHDRVADIRRLADVVLGRQKADGGLNLGGAAPNDLRLETYFNNYTAYSLYLAADVTGDPHYAEAADRWLRWYAAWMHPDGTIEHFTGTYPDWVRGDLDAQDSCPATYFLAVWKGATRLRPPERRVYLAEFMPAVHQTYRAIDEVYLTEGVTLAKRTYPIRYLMDNAETWFGMVAYAKLCRLTGSTHLARVAERRAARTRYALRERFRSRATGWTAWVVPPVGNNARMDLWYPDAHAAVMMLAIAGGPDPADRDLWRRLVDKFDVGEAPGRPEGLSAATIYAWWALAGIQVGDTAGAEHFRRLAYDAMPPGDPTMLNQACGYLIRVLAYTATRTLWF